MHYSVFKIKTLNNQPRFCSVVIHSKIANSYQICYISSFWIFCLFKSISSFTKSWLHLLFFFFAFLYESNIMVIKIFWQIYSIFQKKKNAPYLFSFTKNISWEIAQATKSQQQPLSCHNIQLIKATFNQRLLKLKAIIMIKGL